MNDHHHVYTKSRLIKELAFRAGIKKTASRQILEVLAEIVKRGQFFQKRSGLRDITDEPGRIVPAPEQIDLRFAALFIEKGAGICTHDPCKDRKKR